MEYAHRKQQKATELQDSNSAQLMRWASPAQASQKTGTSLLAQLLFTSVSTELEQGTLLEPCQSRLPPPYCPLPLLPAPGTHSAGMGPTAPQRSPTRLNLSCPGLRLAHSHSLSWLHAFPCLISHYPVGLPGVTPKYTACTQILISDYQPRRAIWFHPGAHRAEPKTTTSLRLLLKSGCIQAFPSPSLRGDSDSRIHRPSHSNPPGQDPRQVRPV